MAIKCPKCQADNPDTVKFCGDCGIQLPSIKDVEVTETMEAPKEELTTGSTFAGRYQIIEELGRGGMGRVYKATDTKINEKVALKLIKPEIASDKKTLERFANELRIARKIVHKNVGRMYDINEEKGTHYITMEYVSGQDLKGFIRQSGQMGVGTAISIIKQVCEGLSEAHKTGVTHRDLKPSNIMIDKEGNVRIMDFGIARSLKEKGITGAGVMIGTPEYMSPEQAEAKEVDQRSDIYSLGVILYEMVTGRVPFEGDTALSIAMKHKGEVPKNPKEYNAQIPDDLNNLILKCLEKDKNSRFQSAGEIRSALENIEKGIPTTDKEIPKRGDITSKEITVSFSVKRFLIPIVAIIALVVIGIFLWHPWSSTEAPPKLIDKPSVAVLPFDDFSPQKDQEHRCYGIPTDLINRLNKVQDLWVPARASSFSFGGENLDIKAVGEKLGVKTVLLGTLQKEKDELRISVELVNIADNATLWQEEYPHAEGNILDLIDEISLAILDNLNISLLGDEKTDFMRRHTENMEAYDLNLKGQYFVGRRNEKDIRDSIDYFEKAIEIDPNYALAYSGLAYALTLIPLYSNILIDEVRHKVIEVTQKASDLDPMIPELHYVLGTFYYISWEWDKAETELKRAIELNPNYAEAYMGYSFYLFQLTRHDKAIKNINIALKLDPLSLIINQNVGEVYYYARKYDRSIEATNRTIEMDPAFPQAHYFLGRAYLAKGMHEKAMEEFRLEKTLPKSWRPYYVDSVIGVTYAKQGVVEEAKKILSGLKEESLQTNVPPYPLAFLCFALGKNDEGLDFLETAYSLRDAYLANINVDPLFDSVRTEPRFIKLLEKMGLD